MLDSGFLLRIRRRERAARRVIVAGGILIVISVLGILLQIASVAVPLFFSPSARVVATLDLPGEGEREDLIAIGFDDYFETGFRLDRDGTATYFRFRSEADPSVPPNGASIELATPGASVFSTKKLESPGGAGFEILSAWRHGSSDYTIVWSDGSVSRDRIELVDFSDTGERSAAADVTRLGAIERLGDVVEARFVTLSGGAVAVLSKDAQGLLEFHLQTETTSSSGTTETVEQAFALDEGLPGNVRDFLLSADASRIYATTDNGWIVRWQTDLTDREAVGVPKLSDELLAVEGRSQLTALSFVFGDQAVVTGDSDGRVIRWFAARSESSGGRRRLTRVGRLPDLGSPASHIAATERDKSILVLNDAGVAVLDHTTSERRMLRFEGERPFVRATMNARSDGLLALDDAGRLHLYEIDNPHPEVSPTTLFGKVWYEGFDEPSYSWQSSASTQDSEPKISLVPLLFGTIKGTLYAMLFAVPVAVLAALYTSQFLQRRLRGIVKPLIEIMAAIPSVVIGFLASMWFAPILQQSMGGLFLAFILFPVFVFGTVFAWYRMGLDRRFRSVKEGYEFLVLVPSMGVALLVSLWVGQVLESILFAGDMQVFLYENVGVVYDPRNCIVIAFALGFAVIPIIFTIAEDSLSNVPRSLAAGSLALGASRWQTAWRVVLPAGAPGIFAAVMIGLGRAIGETMIVLMATGNTPIMDWSPFNGMRTISATIAVEAPEAPYLGSLYRVLFLSAVILFVVTFALNTVAEIVRHRIRKKYARF